MHVLAFLIGFVAVMLPSVARLAASDSEPLGAAAALYFFGFALLAMSTLIFALSAMGRVARGRALLALIAGALSSGAFYGVVAAAFPALNFGMVVSMGFAAALSISLALPMSLRRVPSAGVTAG